MVKILPIDTDNLKKPQIKTKPTTINDSEFMDINGNPYPQILTLDNIRDIYDDELTESFREDARRGFKRKNKSYYEGYRDGLQNLFFKLFEKGKRITELQYRPRTWLGIYDDVDWHGSIVKRYRCMNCQTELENNRKYNYCPNCGWCFMTPDERKKRGLAPEDGQN